MEIILRVLYAIAILLAIATGILFLLLQREKRLNEKRRIKLLKENIKLLEARLSEYKNGGTVDRQEALERIIS